MKVRTSWRRKGFGGVFALSFLLTLLSGRTETGQGTIPVSFNGGLENWSNPIAWSAERVPDNGSVEKFAVTLGGTGTLTLDVNPTVTELNLSSASVTLNTDFARSLVVEDRLNWTGGNLGDGATLSVSNATVNGGGNVGGSVFNITGLWSHNSGALTTVTAKEPDFNVLSGASYDVSFDGAAMDGGFGGRIDVSAGGALRKISGTGVSSFNSHLGNDGLVDVQTGTMRFRAGSTIGGTNRVSAGATLDFESGTFFMSNGARVEGDGTWLIRRPVDVGTGTVIGDVFTSHTADELRGTGTLRLLRGVLFSGGDIGDGLTLSLEGSATNRLGTTTVGASTVNLSGYFKHEGGVVSSATLDSPVFNLMAGSVYDVHFDATLFSGDGGDRVTIASGGLLQKTNSLSTATIDWNLVNNGLLRVGAGKLSLTEGAALGGTNTIGADGELQLTAGSFSMVDGAKFDGGGLLRISAGADLGNAAIAMDVPVRFSGGGIAGSGVLSANTNAFLDDGDLLETVTLNLNGNATKSTSTTSVGANQINVNGVLTQTGGNFSSTSGLVDSLLTIRNGAVYDAQSDATILSGDAGDGLLVEAGGLFQKTNGVGVTVVDWRLTNNGTVRVTSGTLRFTEGALLNGTNESASGTVLHMSSGSFRIGAGTKLSGDGRLQLSAGADLGSDTVSLDIPVTHAGGILTGVGLLNANRDFTFGEGDLDATLTLNLNADGFKSTSTTTLDANVVNVFRDLIQSGGVFFSSSSQQASRINLKAGAGYSVETEQTILSGDAGDILHVEAGAVLGKPSGTGVATVDWKVLNDGLVHVAAGELSFTEGAQLNGTNRIDSGAMQRLTSGMFNLAESSRFEGDGVLRFQSGADFGSGVVTLGTPVQHASGLWTGTGTVNLQRPVEFFDGDLESGLVLNVITNASKTASTTSMDSNTINLITGLKQSGGIFSSRSSQVNSAINVKPGAVYEIDVNATILSGDLGDLLTLEAGSTLRKTNATGTTTIDWRLVNDGIVDVGSGVLSLSEGAVFNATNRIGTGAELSLTSGSFLLKGTSKFEGAGQLAIRSGADIGLETVALDVPTLLAGGLLTGSGTLNVNRAVTLGDADLDGTLALNLNAGGQKTSLTTSLDANTISVSGTLTLDGGVFSSTSSQQNSTINVLSGALCDLRSDSTLFSGDNGDRLVIANGATLRKSAGTGTTTIDWRAENAGTIEVQTGSLNFSEGGDLGPSLSVASGGVARLSSGTFNLTGGGAATGGGTFEISSAAMVGSGATYTADCSVSLTGGGNLGGAGIFSADASVNFAGGGLVDTVAFNLNQGGLITLGGTMEDITMNISGTLVHSNGAFGAGSGRAPKWIVRSGAVYDVRAAGATHFGDGDEMLAIAPGGTLLRTSTDSSVTMDWPVTNGGTVEVRIGELNVTEGYTQTNGVTRLNGGDLKSTFDLQLDGGRLEGTGLITLGGGRRLVNAGGTVAPGNSPGILSIKTGGYRQLSGGSLAIEIGGATRGSGYDALLVTNGTVELAGNLSVNLINGYQPGGSETFAIVEAAGGVSGAFENVVDNRLVVGGGVMRVLYEANRVVLSAFEAGLISVTNLAGNGSWSDGNDWQPQLVPTNSTGLMYAARLINAGSMRLDIDATVSELLLSNASLTLSGTSPRRLDVVDSFVWAGGVLGGGMTLNVGGGSITASGEAGSLALDVSGTLNHAAGTVTSSFATSPRLNVLSNGVYNLTFDGSPFTGDAGDHVVVNEGGVFRKSSGAGDSAIGWAVTNLGTIDVRAGSLSLRQGATIGGRDNVDAGAELRWDAGTFRLLEGGTSSGSGTTRVGASVVGPAGGVYSISNRAVLASGGQLSGGGVLALSGGGQIGDGFTMASGPVLDIASEVIHTGGSVVSAFANSPRVRIRSGGVLDYADDSGFFSGDSGDTITNAPGGLLRKSGGSGTNVIGWALDNQGAIEVRGGQIHLTGGGDLGGLSAISNNAVMSLAGGTFNLLDGGQLTGIGPMQIASAVNVGAGASFTNRGVIELVGGGVLTGPGSLDSSGVFKLFGGTVGNMALINLRGTGVMGESVTHAGTLDVFGVLNQTNGQNVSGFAASPNVRVKDGGVYAVGFDGIAFAGDSGDDLTVESGGTFRKSAGSGISSINWNLSNSGNIDVQSGELAFQGGGVIDGGATIGSGAVLHCDAGTFTLFGARLMGQGVFRVSSALDVVVSDSIVESPVELTGGGSIRGSSVLALSGGGSIGGGFALFSGPVLDIRSRVSHSGGTLVSGFANSPVVRISGGGILDYPDESGGFAGDGGDTITNALDGVILKSGGIGTNTLNWSIDNQGRIEARSGVLSFGVGGELGGLLALSNSAAIQLGGGTFTLLGGGQTRGPGSLRIASTANAATGGTYSAAGVTELVVGGTIGGPGVFETLGDFIVSGGTFGAGSIVEIQSNAFIAAAATLSGTIHVNGTLTHTNGGLATGFAQNPTIRVRTNGVYAINAGGTPLGGDGGDNLIIEEGGILRRSAGGDGIVNWTLENRGTIDIGAGSLTFRNGGTLGGTATIESGGELHLDGGTFSLMDGATSAGGGSLRVSSTLNVPDAATYRINGLANLEGGSTLTGLGTLVLSGGGSIGGLQIFNGALLDVRSVVSVTNGAVSSAFANNPVMNISSGGAIVFPDDSGSVSGDSGDSVNILSGGALRKTGGSGTSQVGWRIGNGGEVRVDQGTLRILPRLVQTNGSTIVSAINAVIETPGGFSLDGGVFAGLGTLTGSLDQRGGRVSPGASVGSLAISGAYVMSGGAVLIELDTDEVIVADRLTVGGTVSLSGGDLEVSFLNNVRPAPDDSFVVLSASGITGTFANTPGNRLTLPSIGTFDVTYSATEVRLGNFVAEDVIIFTEQPQSLAVRVGESAAFQARVTTGGTPAFQWLKDGEAIAGETTDTLAFTSVVLSDAGDYSLRVVVGGTTNLSATAALDVSPAPGAAGSGSARSVALDEAGNRYVVGTFTNSVRFGALDLTGVGADLFIVKFDSSANVLWARSAGGAGGDYGNSVAVDSAGNVYVGGSIESRPATFGTNSVSATGADAFVAKYDGQGNNLWVVAGGGAGTDEALAVAAVSDGVLAVGRSSHGGESGLVSFGAANLTVRGGTDGFVLKLSGAGQTVWLRQIGGAGDDAVRAVAVDAAGTIFVGGEYGSTDATFDGTATVPNRGGLDAFTARYSSSGDLAWVTTGGGAGDESVNAVAVGKGDLIVAAGFSASAGSVFTGSQASLSSRGGKDVLLWRMNSAGAGVGAQLNGGTGEDEAHAIGVDGRGDIFTVGEIASPDAVFGDVQIGTTGTSGFIAKFDDRGTNRLVLKIGDSGASLFGLALGRLDLAVVGSYSTPTITIGNITLTNAGTSAAFLVNFGNNTLFITEQPSDVSVAAGMPALFSVEAVSDAPIAYQWRKEGVPLLSATNRILNLPNVQPADAGPYTVVVSSLSGSATSAVANLTITSSVAAPQFLVHPQDRLARTGASVVFEVSATNAVSYRWFHNGNALSDGATIQGSGTARLTLHRVGADSVGNYFARAFNGQVSVTSSNGVLTVGGNAIVEEVGSWPDAPRGEAFDVRMNGTLAYVASGGAGLNIFSLTNATNFVRVGGIATPGFARGVEVIAGRAYVADGTNGLGIFDVSEPRHPRQIGAIDTPGHAEDVFVTGNFAYVADLTNGLQIVNVSDPGNPLRMGGFDTPGRAEGVFVSGGLAYVADMAAGLQIISVTNPAAPVLVGTLDTPGFPRDVVVIGTNAFVADWSGGFRIVDVSDPSAPRLRSALTNVGSIYGVTVFGDRAYLAAFDQGLRVIDISDLSNPVSIGLLDTAGLALAVDSDGTNAVLADWTGGLIALSVTNANPLAIGSVNARGSSWAVQVVGTRAYVADYDAGLQILDVSDVTDPRRLGGLDTDGLTVGLFVTNDLAFLADHDRGLVIVDVSDPARPIRRGDFDTDGFARDVVVRGGYAFLADDSEGLKVIDVGNPSAPSLTGALRIPGAAQAIRMDGALAYVASYAGGLNIVSVSNHASPVLIGSALGAGQAWDVTVADGVAYVADGTTGLKIYDVRNPESPTLVGQLDTGSIAIGVSLTGSILAIADWEGGLRLVDVSNPKIPRFAESFGADKLVAGAEIAGDYIYVPARAHGVSIVNLPMAGGFAPLISTQPVNRAGRVGDFIAFVVDAVGSPDLLYQWTKDGIVLTGATNRGLTLTNIGLASAGSYAVTVTNNFGRVTSLAAGLAVQPRLEPDFVIFDLASLTFQNGELTLGFDSASSANETSGEYRVQVSTDLVTWEILPDVPRATEGQIRVVDPDAGREACRFYRVIRR